MVGVKDLANSEKLYHWSGSFCHPDRDQSQICLSGPTEGQICAMAEA